MALSAPPGQELPPGKQFSYQLAAAVRSINWTYAIFWSTSTSVRPAGVLTWNDGFYNGEMKTRKITNSTRSELTADERVLQRSEQLRELYYSLSSGKSDHRARRPAASLSPEDLADAEWYYMLSMTYTFQPGQGLPGKSLASNQHVWLCNAQHADTKTFQRVLLAKTTSIQTVVCIPFMGGVLELGISNLVLEDTSMVNWIGTSFWKISSLSTTNEIGDANIMFEDLDHNTVDGVISEPWDVERITKDMDDFHSFCETLEMSALEENWIMDEFLELPSCTDTVPATGMLNVDDIIETINNSIHNSHRSSFTTWRRPLDMDDMVVRVNGESQNLLKKVLAGSQWMDKGGGDTTTRAQQGNIKAHVMSERRRREKINEMFLILKSMVAPIQKMDKASILVETIAYLKVLEERVKGLKSRPATSCPKETTGWRQRDVANGNLIKVSAKSKRKASEVHRQQDIPSNVVNVAVMEKEVLLEVQCRSKEFVMTQLFDAIKSLCLDVISVQASTHGGLLGLKIRASQQYVIGSTTMEPGMITEVMREAIGKSWKN